MFSFCLISVTGLTQSHKHYVCKYTHIQGCSAHFSSLMGYQYHQKCCGSELSDDERPVFLCQHCGKTYRSKAGRDYHVRTEHSSTITTTMTATTNNNNNNKDSITDTNNNTGKERVRSFWKPVVIIVDRGVPCCLECFLLYVAKVHPHFPLKEVSYCSSRWSLRNLHQ